MCEDNALQEEKRTREEQTLGAGAVIARRRKVLGLSQEALAEKMDVSRQAVAKWENGQAFPTAERLTRLCRVLEVTPEELLPLFAWNKLPREDLIFRMDGKGPAF